MDTQERKYIIFDVESVPDARLIRSVRYPDMEISEKEAVMKFQEEILANSDGATLFIPATFQYPVSIGVAYAAQDFTLLDLELLDEPEFRTSEMVRIFWNNLENKYKDASIVTFNGRGFDIPLLELMAYRYGYTMKRHYKDKFGSRYRFGTKHIDIQDWLSNFSAIRMNGGLNLLAKVIGMPGKMDAKGDDVYDMFLNGKIKEINDYCTHDVLDTYFVFLRTRVLTGEITLENEKKIIDNALQLLDDKKNQRPALEAYLKNCVELEPWP